MSEVVDLSFARRQLAPAAWARQRFAQARAASGQSPSRFAGTLTRALGWPVSADAVTAWESTAVPPGDALVAAETAAGVLPSTGQVLAEPVRLLDSYGSVQAELARVVDEAEQDLAITGSRSRDPDYLARVEGAVRDRESLRHTRVLYGPPRHSALKQHLLRLVGLGRDGLRVGILRDLLRDGERFIAANERTAVIVIPSQWSLHNFDTAMAVDDPDVAGRYVAHVRQAWLASEPLATRTDVEALEVVR